MIYLWDTPRDYPTEMIGTYLRDQSPDRFLFKKGNPVTNTLLPSIRFNVSADALAKYDVLDSNAMVPLVSEAVSELLLKLFPEDVQLIEARIITNDKEISGYNLLNVIRLVNCVDHNSSEYVFIPSTDAIMKFNRLRLKPECMTGFHLAREAEYTSYLYVSQLVKDAFEAKKWRGFVFSPPESVHP